MSTRYTAVRKLTKETKNAIIDALQKDDYAVAEGLLSRTDEIEIGHRAGGWKFSWYPFNDKLEALTKNGIIEYVMNDDILIYDEYNELQDKKEFLEMAFNWCKDGYDSVSYYKKHPYDRKFDCAGRQLSMNEWLANHGFKPVTFDDIYQSDFESDGLRWTILE